mmetsp:Transcript_4517/g.14581  ORF Transcript_4517/g.14581 Transcript_4517/m.14581 type:complete len:199 (+) Transcript_4517:73-669(+)
MEFTSKDVFADGTSVRGGVTLPAQYAEPDFASLTQTRFPSRKVKSNPPASELHARETGAPWRVEAEERIAEENKEAEVEIQERRIKRLGIQTADGIKRNYGLTVDFAWLATIIRAAFEQSRSPTPIKVQREVKLALSRARDEQQRMEMLNQFLKAILRFDLKMAMDLVDIKEPEEDSPFKPARRRRRAAGAEATSVRS